MYRVSWIWRGGTRQSSSLDRKPWVPSNMAAVQNEDKKHDKNDIQIIILLESACAK